MLHLALALLLALAAPDELSAVRRRVDKLALALAKDGLSEVAALCVDELAALGAPSKTLASVRAKVDKAAARAGERRPRDAARARHASAAGAVAAELMELHAAGAAVGDVQLPLRALAFDGADAAAHAALGHERGADGVWRTPALAQCARRRVEIAAARVRAAKLEFALEQPAERDPTLDQLVLGSSAVRYRGLVIESTIAQARLEEIVRATLRAMAWSSWLMGGELEPQPMIGRFLHVPDLAAYRMFLAAAEASTRLEPGRVAELRAMGGFWIDAVPRGRAAQALVHRASALELSGIALLYFDGSLRREQADGDFGDTVTPHWVKVGHYNYVGLAFLGAGIPSVVVRDLPDGFTRSDARQVDSRLPNAGLIGCRSWLAHLVGAGRAPQLAATMLDQGGKISGDLLLKATAALEHLHERGDVAGVVERYAAEWLADRQRDASARTVLERSELALAQPLSQLEAEWEAWLTGGEAAGIRQRAAGAAGDVAPGPEAQALLAALNATRHAAGLEPVALDGPLSRGAQLHAAYLEQHAEQKLGWPAAHDEYPDSSGFTPAGAWAGAHSVIAFNGSEVALDEWLGTFYHRLPLVHPGLVWIGFGAAADTTVVDCTSVVDPTGNFAFLYPADGQRDVPRRFVPELPSPVPGRDQATLGFPITLQLGAFFAEPEVELALFREPGGEPVECIVSTPQQPSNPKLAPAGAYCLIPVEPLAAKTDYRVEARLPADALTAPVVARFKTR